MSFQKDLSKRSLPLKALGLFFFRCCSSTSLARAHQSFKRAAWGQRLLVVEMGDFDPFQWSKGWQLRFPAKGLKNPYTSPSLQIVYWYCNLYTYYMLYIAIYVHCVHIHWYRPYPSMSAIYLPKFVFFLRFFVTQSGSMEVSVTWINLMALCTNKTPWVCHVNFTLLKLLAIFWMIESWLIVSLVTFKKFEHLVGLGNQTRKRCLERTHKEMSPCLGEEYCVQYHWRRTFHGMAVIRFMSYSNQACFCWVTFVDARFLKQRSSNSCASHARGWSEPEPFN